MFSDLRLHQDTVFLIQLSLNCKLESGIIDEPVALRGVHNENRIINQSLRSDSRLLMWRHLYTWSLEAAKSKHISGLFEAYWIKERIAISKRLPALFLLIRYSFKNFYFFSKGTFFNTSCIRAFGKKFSGAIINLKDRIPAIFFRKGDFENNYRKELISKI